ncbi:lipase-like PAD4 [Magnolia sinica]|uniref:lipase-like PAD4 n=1 Tax=Magnolia sinica TaxID=86752 RepID=UPI00265A644C|nr:lipase-like PAD4 [Magnolia sinica]
MVARGEEASPFESSQMLAAFLASTPLLSDSWQQCSIANSTAPERFVIDRIGDVAYVAFSGVPAIPVSNWDSSFTQIHAGDGDNPLSSLGRLVHAGFFHMFLSIYNNSAEFSQILATVSSNKAVVFTGHSIGGTIASLATLYLLSSFPSLSSTVSLLCITFGSPLLGNEALSRAILKERWGGRFCHVVSKHDIVPRLLFAPLDSVSMQLNQLLEFWHSLMRFPQRSGKPITQLSYEDVDEFRLFVSDHLAAAEAAAEIEQEEGSSCRSLYTPFGSYLFCSEEGAICIDNSTAIVQMLHLLFMTSSVRSSIEEHLMYGNFITKISQQFLKRRGFTQGLCSSGYDVGMSLALQALGMGSLDPTAQKVQKCLMKARHMGRRPNLNSANLAISLSKITPYRAQVEWYKAYHDDHMGYYDAFKLRSSKRDSTVNMCRLNLGNFWDEVIGMLQKKQLPHDFHKRAKWVNAAHFYRLLVEPLEIADYYRSGQHRTQGHYIMHGRETRFKLFDSWWQEKERTVGNDGKGGGSSNKVKRSRFAGLTQDPCFWARLEEAREWAVEARSERDAGKLVSLWENMNKFESYANELVERKEVSKDVLAKDSSYVLWIEDWRELKSELELRILPALRKTSGPCMRI